MKEATAPEEFVDVAAEAEQVKRQGFIYWYYKVVYPKNMYTNFV